MKKYLLFAISFFVEGLGSVAQPFASWNKTELRLNNGVVEKTITLPGDKGKLITRLYKPVKGEFKYLLPVNTEFQFAVNGATYTGKGNWMLKDVVIIIRTKLPPS